MDYKKNIEIGFKPSKNFKAPRGPHGSEGMAGDHVFGYVRDSAAHMVTKHTIKDVKTTCMAL